MKPPLVRAALALTLLAAFAAAFQQSSRDRSDVAAVTRCEIDMPDDEAALAECLVLAPDNIEVMLELAQLYEAAGQWDRAEAMYRRASEVDPRDAELHLRLGRAMARRGDAAGALEEGQLVLALRPNSAAALALINP